MNLRNMEKHTLYYWAKMYQSLHRGEEYEELNRAITINLLNFSLLPQKQAHTMYGLYDLASGHRLTEDIEIHFLEIPNFEVKSVREMKRLERWLAYFSNKLNETVYCTQGCGHGGIGDERGSNSGSYECGTRLYAG